MELLNYDGLLGVSSILVFSDNIYSWLGIAVLYGNSPELVTAAILSGVTDTASLRETSSLSMISSSYSSIVAVLSGLSVSVCCIGIG